MNILIVEDDSSFADILKKDVSRFISDFVPRCRFNICNNNYLDVCRSFNCDIAFVDIQLDNQNLGLQLAKEIVDHNDMVTIVFVSSQNNLMHDTFIVQPFFFIRKTNYKKDFLIFCSLYEKKLKSKEFIILTYNHTRVPISKSEIYYVEIQHNILYVHTKNHVYKDNKSLKQFTNDLDDKYFIQIHKSFAVHLKYIYALKKDSVILRNKTEIKIGRSYARKFTQLYKEYLLS